MKIIGLTGLAGSGKDTAADFSIKRLRWKCKDNRVF